MAWGQRGGAMVALMVLLCSLSTSPASSSPEEEFVRKTVSSHQIVIFSKSYCPYDRLFVDLCSRLVSTFVSAMESVKPAIDVLLYPYPHVRSRLQN